MGSLCREKVAGESLPGENGSLQWPPCMASSHPPDTSRTSLWPVWTNGLLSADASLPTSCLLLPQAHITHLDGGTSLKGTHPSSRPGPSLEGVTGHGSRCARCGLQGSCWAKAVSFLTSLRNRSWLPGSHCVRTPGKVQGCTPDLRFSVSNPRHSMTPAAPLPLWQGQRGPFLSQDPIATSATCRSPEQALGFFRDQAPHRDGGRWGARPHLSLHTKPVRPGSIPRLDRGMAWATLTPCSPHGGGCVYPACLPQVSGGPNEVTPRTQLHILTIARLGPGLAVCVPGGQLP